MARHVLLVLAALAACASPGGRPSAPTPAGSLAPAESLFLVLRTQRDHIDVADAAGRSSAGFVRLYDSLRAALGPRLAALDSASLNPEDARALGTMRTVFSRDLRPVAAPATASEPAAAPSCTYGDNADSVSAALYACYGWAQSHVVVDGDTLDRLTVLGTLGQTEDVARRRELFLSLEPVWHSVNADNGPASPYRRLIALEVKQRGDAESLAAVQARASGVNPDSLERWLLAILEAWRDGTPDSLVEPWDWSYQSGKVSRTLSPRISRERMIQLNEEVYRALGVDLGGIRAHYDLDAREGKTPVAFTTFGSRAPIEPWVFATYRTGGLDNLNELLHETGHAAHIAAIRTRPAFTDWPDSDPFTEAVADFVALDVYEPVWQQRWLGDSVPLADGLRARYSGIVLDVAWALLELRMLRDPKADPNRVWTALTGDYLHIRPHPELSWWAMRGQLVDEPGYMMNYAAGAILIAAIRARTVELHGPFVAGDSTWYGWIAPRLFRFGLGRPTREVIEEFLGGPVTPAALLADMRRMSR